MSVHLLSLLIFFFFTGGTAFLRRSALNPTWGDWVVSEDWGLSPGRRTTELRPQSFLNLRQARAGLELAVQPLQWLGLQAGTGALPPNPKVKTP